MSLIDLSMSKDINIISRNHVFAKEQVQKFWDHFVSMLTYSKGGIVLSIYARDRVVFSLAKSPNKIIIYIVEIVNQKKIMKYFYKALAINKSI